MQIVTANYIDREDPIKWLARHIDSTTPTKKRFIECVHGSFLRGSKAEEGFGCNVVAANEIWWSADDDEELDDNLELRIKDSLEGTQRLYFVRYRFFLEPEYITEVKSFKRLVLHDHIYAEL